MTFQKLTIFFLLSFFVASTAFGQDKKTAAGVYNEGLALLKAKDYAAGYTLMEEALTLAETDENEKVLKLAKKNGATAAYNVANTKRKAGSLDEALVLYNRGIELNPEYASNFRGKGMVFEKQGNKLEAINTYLKAAGIYTAGDKADKANDIYKKTQNIVGKAYIAKSYDEAIKLATAHLAVKQTADVNYYLGKSQLAQEKMDEALVSIDKAISMATKPEDKYFDAKATILEKQGKNAEAVAEYKKITGEKYKPRAEQKIKTLGI